MVLSEDDAVQRQVCANLGVLEAFVYAARSGEGIERQVPHSPS